MKVQFEGLAYCALLVAVPVLVQEVTSVTTWRVKGHQKIATGEGGFSATLDTYDYFGLDVEALGDLDGDGNPELAVGAPGDDDGGLDHGAVYILSLQQDGSVLRQRKISQLQGGFTGSLDDSDYFGRSVARIGDLDGDGTDDLAVGTYRDDDGGLDRGAVYILFLRPNGTVRAQQKISDFEGGFTGQLDNSDFFGNRVVGLNDLDGDGVEDLAVAASFDDDGGQDRGAIWILFLNPNGTVKTNQKISFLEGGFTGALSDFDYFGSGASFSGDLDGDGIGDLIVGARGDDDGGNARGAIWVLFLHADGTVKGQQKISSTEGGFQGLLDDGDQFGLGLAMLDPGKGHPRPTVAVGSFLDDDGGFDRGAVWLLDLNPDGRVFSHRKISQTQGGFRGSLDDQDNFGTGIGSIGDLDRDGTPDLAVGAWLDEGIGQDTGAVWILFLRSGSIEKEIPAK